MALTAVMTTLAACSQDDELMDAAPKATPIEFEITDGGYGGDEATRAVEEGLRTKFEAGDKCGLYIIDNDEFIANNVMLTAEAGENGEITWKVTEGDVSKATENSKYFLYYPYGSDLCNWSALVGDDDETVFRDGIEHFGSTVRYQDTYAQYTKNDLMTATGTASTGADGKLKVSFSMKHRMALAVIELPKTVYKFEGTSIPDYTVALSADFSGSDYRPLRMEDGTYRFVFNPELTNIKSITGIINGNKKFTITAENLKGIDKGTYKTFRIGGANATIEQKHTLQVGDYLLNDGNLISKDETLSESQKANVAAIVFSAGHNLYDKSDYSETGIGSKECHGYAVAVMDAVATCKWGHAGTPLGCRPEGDNANAENDWNGYDYTWNKIISDAGGIASLVSSYPATYYAVKHGTNPPACSSGWFLPAIGQMKEVWTQRETLFQNFGEALSTGGYYWSSSESSEAPSTNVKIVINDGIIQNSHKESTRHVRAILAF